MDRPSSKPTIRSTASVRPAPLPKALHVTIGIAVVVASAFVATGRSSAILAAAAIAYVAWTTSRSAGLILAFAATVARFTFRSGRGNVDGNATAVLLAACVVYAVIAIIVSAIERATRPG